MLLLYMLLKINKYRQHHLPGVYKKCSFNFCLLLKRQIKVIQMQKYLYISTVVFKENNSELKRKRKVTTVVCILKSKPKY